MSMMQRVEGAHAPAGAPSRARVLSIAGTDPTGGAGIQADLKSFAAHGAYGMAVVTALVAQNTRGVRGSLVPDPLFLRAQLDAVSDDVTVDAAKVGMVATGPVAGEIAAWVRRAGPPHLVVDPVIVATSGHRLLDAGAEQAVRELVDLADLVTPNLPELAALLGEEPARGWEDALGQARRLADRHGVVVLLKGGHLEDLPERSPDAVVDSRSVIEIDSPRVPTPHTHGTGCSLSAAVTALRPRRPDWCSAVREAKEWLTGALLAAEALQVGQGRGPVDHLHHLPVQPAAASAGELH
jgi:hydroxymethylpyrimidine/phosphomethylpyrimidine kinase